MSNEGDGTDPSDLFLDEVRVGKYVFGAKFVHCSVVTMYLIGCSSPKTFLLYAMLVIRLTININSASATP